MDIPKLVLEARPALNNEGRNLSALFSPTRAMIDPDDGTAAGCSRSPEDQASSNSDSSRENVVNSDMGTASGDYIPCSDADEVTTQTAQMKYQKRVSAS